MSITTENIQTNVGNLNNAFSGREGDSDYDMNKMIHIHRRNRPFVWPFDMQAALIDSILNGYYIPPIICSSKIIDGRERREVMEGGNRITTFRRILREDIRPLSVEERIRIETYPITLVIMRNMDIKTQRIMFRRLNKNIKVTDGQLYSMSEDDSPLVKEAIAFLDDDNYPLRNLITENFFDTRHADSTGKKNLENAVAIISGLLNGPHYISKSYNIQESQIENQDPIERQDIIDRLLPIFEIFTMANTIIVQNDRRKVRGQWMIGKWIGAIIYDIYIANKTQQNISNIQYLWANYIAAVRRGDALAEDASLLSGAQNLTATRYCRVCAKINIYMNEHRIAGENELLPFTHIDDDEEMDENTSEVEDE